MSDILKIVVSELDGFIALPSDAAQGALVLVSGLESERPAPGLTNLRLYWATDTKRLFRDAGTSWETIGSLQHDDLSDLLVDVHTQYVERSGARAMTGHLLLPNASPTDPLHAAPKSYVDQSFTSKASRFQLGLGFKQGAISTGDIFANLPVASLFAGALLRGWVVTAKVAGSSTTTIQLQRNGAQVSVASLGATQTFVETELSLPISLVSGDVISAAVTAAGGHQHVGIFIYGTVGFYG